MDDAPPAELLRPDVCAACGYPRRGLDDTVPCPECGRAFDPCRVVLHGWACGPRANIANGRPLRTAWWLATLLAVALAFALLLHGSGRRGAGMLPAALFVVVAVGSAASTLWRRSAHTLPAPLQVRLGPDGFLQLNHDQTTLAWRPVPWREADEVHVAPVRLGRMRIRIWLRRHGWQARLVAVDAAVHSTPEQATALQERVRAWRAADPRPSAPPASQAVQSAT